MDRRHAKVALIGFGILVAGVLIMIFWDSWGDRTGIVNPLGVFLTIGGVFSILWGLGIRMGEG